MVYTCHETSERLTAIELDAARALAVYTAGSDTNWTPADKLYAAYLAHYQQCNGWMMFDERWKCDPCAWPPLTVRQFGYALRRLFPTAKRYRRWTGGKRVYGYTGIKGPWSTTIAISTRPVKSNCSKGIPPNDMHVAE